MMKTNCPRCAKTLEARGAKTHIDACLLREKKGLPPAGTPYVPVAQRKTTGFAVSATHTLAQLPTDPLERYYALQKHMDDCLHEIELEHTRLAGDAENLRMFLQDKVKSKVESQAAKAFPTLQETLQELAAAGQS